MLRLIRRFTEEHKWACLLFLAVYTPLVILPHEKVQALLFEQFVKPFGASSFYAVMATLGLAGLAGGSSVIWRAVRSHPQRAVLIRHGLLTLALVLAAWRLLTVNNSELVHFVQYAVPGFVILGITGSVTHTMAWITLMGGLDEGYQYAGLHGGWGIPYDFNDVYLDVLGGAIGVHLALADRPPLPWRGWREIVTRPGVALLLAIAGGTALLLLSGHALLYEDKANPNYWFALSRLRMPGFWFFDETWGPRKIHALRPLEGPVLILATLAIYARLDRQR